MQKIFNKTKYINFCLYRNTYLAWALQKVYRTCKHIWQQSICYNICVSFPFLSENLLQPSFFYAFCLTWLHVNNNFAPTLGGNASTISKLVKFIKKYLMRRFKKLEWNVQSTNLMMPCQREYRISLMVVF